MSKTCFAIIHLFYLFLLKVEWPWNCERRCKSLKIDPSKNVILLSGDRMMSAQCDSITESHSGVLIWDKKVKNICTESYKQNMRNSFT